MIVAAGTSERHSEERHARTLGDIDRVAMEGEVVGGSVAQGRALRGDDRSRELVPRLVLLHALTYEPIEGPHRGGRKPIRGDKEEVGPFIGPVVDELGAGKKPVDELDAFLGVGIDEVGANLVGSRQRSGGVERCPADESRVVRRARWRDCQRFELGEILLVDRVESRGVAEHFWVDRGFVR